MNIVKLLRLDIPNKNGRVYTKECMDNALKDFTKKDLFIQTTLEIKSINDVVGHVNNLRIDGEFLLADAYFYESMKRFVGETINVRPIGSGTITNGVVENYKILGMAVVTPTFKGVLNEIQNDTSLI